MTTFVFEDEIVFRHEADGVVCLANPIVGNNSHLSVRIKSSDLKRNHAEMKAMRGKRVRVTVEILD